MLLRNDSMSQSVFSFKSDHVQSHHQRSSSWAREKWDTSERAFMSAPRGSMIRLQLVAYTKWLSWRSNSGITESYWNWILRWRGNESSLAEPSLKLLQLSLVTKSVLRYFKAHISQTFRLFSLCCKILKTGWFYERLPS